MSAEQPIASSSAMTIDTEPVVVSVAATKNGRTPGKAHKGDKTATRRSQIPSGLKSTFEKRRELDAKREATKQTEREMKAEAEAERDTKRTALKERREREAEKVRMQEMAARMSAKKLQRMRKRQGRSKKING